MKLKGRCPLLRNALTLWHLAAFQVEVTMYSRLQCNGIRLPVEVCGPPWTVSKERFAAFLSNYP
jgi:hypothetical protein